MTSDAFGIGRRPRLLALAGEHRYIEGSRSRRRCGKRYLDSKKGESMLKDKIMNRWSTYEPFYVPFNGYKVADIFITSHALSRWEERVDADSGGIEPICDFLWAKLKAGCVQPYYANEKDVYLIDDDLVMVAEFSEIKDETDIAENPLHKMIVVTFLGKVSEDIQLRDLKAYYSWLRHSRRMTLVKHGRKHR